MAAFLSPFGITLAGLIALTVGLTAWQHYGMERVIEVSSRTASLYADDDRPSGGASIASVERIGDDTVLRCRIVQQYAYPFCSVHFNMRGLGVDLSNFSYLTLHFKEQDTSAAGLRLRLINFEDGYSRANDWRTFKPNEVSDLLIGADGRVTVPLRWAEVAQWWKDHYKPPRERSFPNLDRVMRVELVTPVGIAPGPVSYRIASITVHGKWISQTQLLIGLVVAWMVFSISWPAFAALTLRRKLHDSKSRLALLAQINRALELETQELANQAYTDGLTGALNRQGMRDALMRTSLLGSGPLSIIFTDIDHFKKINDTHGHDVGDAVLREFAERLRAGIRSSDRLVRWGGEEFLILCSGTGVQQAGALAEKLRESLKSHSWTSELAVTASFGVTEHHDSEDIGEAIRRADEQLYLAKRSGRDQVKTSV